jgi:secreted Zn-dependent insulinase-like peptidase
MGLSLHVRLIVPANIRLVSILFVGTLVSAGAFFSQKVEAQSMKPTITKHDVNGFETIFVNTHTGNSVIFAANVQVGMDHDDPVRTSGLTHLWEHVIHNGSKRFPGYETLDKSIEGLGLSRNANTSGTRTYYFFSGHVDSFEKALPLYGAMFSEPEWNQETFEREKKVVMNEALEYQRRDDMILYSGIKLRTLPADHHFAKYHIGTQEQLAATTSDDLKALYRNNYRPGSTQLIVVGNLDKVPDAEVSWDQEKVLKLLRDNFIPTPDKATAAPAKEMKLPNLVPSEPGKAWVEFGTPNAKHTLLSQFQIDESLPWEVIETIFDFLNSDFEGSLKKVLTDRGWILGGGFHFDQTNNFREGSFQFSLTPEGARNRAELVKFVFSYLGKLKQKGFTPEEREFLYQGNVASYWEAASQTVAVARAISDAINHQRSVDNYFDFERRYGSVDSESVKAALPKIFNTDRMVIAYMGPDVKSDEKDPLFDREIKYPADTAALLSSLKSELEKPTLFTQDASLQIAKVDLPRREQALSGKKEITTPILTKDDRWVLEIDHTYPNAAYHLILDLPHLNLIQETQLQVLVAAFQDRYKGEIGYLAGLQVWGGVSGANSRLDIEMKGNSRSSFAAIQFALEKLIQFVPTKEEMERAAQKLKNAYLSAEDGFSASLAYREAANLMNSLSYGIKDVAETAAHPDFTITPDVVQNLFRSARITGGTAGDVSKDEALEMVSWIRKRVHPLSQAQLSERENASVVINNSARFFRPMIASKSANAIGRARVYSLGKGEPADVTISSLLGEYLWQQVFDINRVRKSLGYVQGGSAMPTHTDSRLFLYGQTEGVDRAPQIEEGWEEALARIPGDTAAIDRFRQGRILSSRVIPETLSARLERRLGLFRLKEEPLGPEVSLKTLRSIDGAKVAAWFATHFKSSTFVDVEVAVTACRDALSNVNQARKAIAGQN